MDVAQLIRKDREIYNQLRSKAHKAFVSGQAEKSLDYIYIASTLAWCRHIGLWCDDALEKILSDVAKLIRDTQGPAPDKRIKTNDRLITHVLSTIPKAGGHFTAAMRFIRAIKRAGYSQNIVITNCSVPSKEEFIPEDIKSDCPVVSLPFNSSYVNRVKLLKEKLEEGTSIVILYIDPNDVIAVTALLAMENKPRTLFFNHADHVFWLGKGIIDTLIEWRIEGAAFSKHLRGIDSLYLVPLSTDIKPQKGSKENLGVPADSTLSLSIGADYKVKEDSYWHYFEAIKKVLKDNPTHYHMLITYPLSGNEIKECLGSDESIKKRFIVRGPVSDLSSFYGTADFLIETFPIIGGTVRLEAMACKLPIVAIHNERFPLLSDSGVFPPDYPFIASSNEDVIKYSTMLIRDSSLRERWGDYLHAHFQKNFSPERVKNLLVELIDNPSAKNIKPEDLGDAHYDLMYTYQWLSKVHLPRSLFIQSIIKPSAFTIRERLRFYLDAVQSGRLKSLAELLGGLFLSFTGWRGARLKFIRSRLGGD